MSGKNTFRILTEIALNRYIGLGFMDVLTLLILPIHILTLISVLFNFFHQY